VVVAVAQILHIQVKMVDQVAAVNGMVIHQEFLVDQVTYQQLLLLKEMLVVQEIQQVMVVVEAEVAQVLQEA
jgi:hypothetical protein